MHLTITFVTPFGFVSWTIPYPNICEFVPGHKLHNIGALPSSLYTFPANGEAWLGITTPTFCARAQMRIQN